MPGRKTSVYLSEKLASQVRHDGRTILELINAGLVASAVESLEDRLRRIVREELDRDRQNSVSG